MKNPYVTGEYLKNNPTWHTEDSLWKAQQILQGLKKASLQPKTVCEIGCGAGEVLYHLQQAMTRDVEFTGYEISPQAFELCVRYRQPRLRFRNEDLLATNSSVFDLLLAIDVLEHIPDYMTALRVLKDKAVHKIFHIPLELTSVNTGIKGVLLTSRIKLGHLHYFNRELALAALQEAGYEIVTEFYTHWEKELAHRRPKNMLERLIKQFVVRCDRNLAVRLFGGHSLLVVAK